MKKIFFILFAIVISMTAANAADFSPKATSLELKNAITNFQSDLTETKFDVPPIRCTAYLVSEEVIGEDMEGNIWVERTYEVICIDWCLYGC